MSRRPSARTLLTLFTVAITSAFVVLLTGVVRESLSSTDPAAAAETTTAIWTVGIFLIALSGFAAWVLSRYLVDPLTAMRRNLTLSARTRAIAEPDFTETHEITTLRATTRAVLEELETRVRAAELAHRHVLELFEATSEGIVQIDHNGRFVHVNAAARSLLRFPSQPEGQPAAGLVRNSELRALFEAAARGEQAPATEVAFDNQQLLVSPVSLVSENGERAGAIITVVNLTELRRLETVRRDFVANVSHELKTPLTSIRGYAETLLLEELPREDQVHFLETIHRNANRLQQIVEDLLDLSRLQSGGWTPAFQNLVLNDLIHDVWQQCEPAAKRETVRFTVNGEAACVHADASGLRQVLSNVIDNALRYTPEGGCITVDIGLQEPYVTVDITDTGTGIPAASLPRIFERFYRVDPARSRADGGTGLGLAVVKHLVERMGGSVSASSTLGSGTTIHLQLLACNDN